MGIGLATDWRAALVTYSMPSCSRGLCTRSSIAVHCEMITALRTLGTTLVLGTATTGGPSAVLSVSVKSAMRAVSFVDGRHA